MVLTIISEADLSQRSRGIRGIDDLTFNQEVVVDALIRSNDRLSGVQVQTDRVLRRSASQVLFLQLYQSLLSRRTL